jgi:hypothetical protein
MTEQQMRKLLAALVEHQKHFRGLPTHVAQWVIKNPKRAIELFKEALECDSDIECESLPENLSRQLVCQNGFAAQYLARVKRPLVFGDMETDGRFTNHCSAEAVSELISRFGLRDKAIRKLSEDDFVLVSVGMLACHRKAPIRQILTDGISLGYRLCSVEDALNILFYLADSRALEDKKTLFDFPVIGTAPFRGVESHSVGKNEEVVLRINQHNSNLCGLQIHPLVSDGGFSERQMFVFMK